MDSRKKILFVITKSNWGGAQRYLFDVATSLPSQEYTVAVACGGNGVLTAKLHERSIPVFEIKSFQRDISFAKEISSVFELWKLYTTFKPDVVHLNSSKAGGLGAFVARCAGIPKIIFTAHGWPFWEPRNFFQKSLIAFFSWLTIVCAHTTICISDYDARVARRMPFVAKKIRRIRNGIMPYALLDRSAARTALVGSVVCEKHASDIWVLTNAELTRNKNHTHGIDAVCAYNQSASQKIFYVCIGDGELREHLAVYVKENDAEHEIILLGFVPDAYRYYAAFDIFLLPSLKEGVPYVLLEAGFAGCACIASNVGGIPEIITHEKSGLLVPPNNVGELKKALGGLCTNETMRITLGAALHRDVIHAYSHTTMIEQTMREYRF